MVFQLFLILLKISLLVMPNGGTCRSLTEASKPSMTSLPQHFRWSHVGTQNITLSWNVGSLGKDYAEDIELTAVSASYFGFYTFRTANFLLGNVTVDGLKPNSTYDVTVQAVGKKGTIFIYEELITTLSHGKHSQIRTLSMPTSSTSKPRAYVTFISIRQ
uniref:EG95 protein n=1 Tax=Echinococcus granulosus TaxID=6210 RepID=A0A068X5J5_ECHGR|nr:EG95 protein [Echinococcus granulosus]